MSALAGDQPGIVLHPLFMDSRLSATAKALHSRDSGSKGKSMTKKEISDALYRERLREMILARQRAYYHRKKREKMAQKFGLEWAQKRDLTPEKTEEYRTCYSRYHKKEIREILKRAIAFMDSVDLSDRGYTREIQPMINTATENPVECPACGKIDNGYPIRGGLCCNCFCEQLHEFLKQQEERKINEASHVEYA